MKSIYYTCPFVPRELIAACGLKPCRVSPALEVDGRLEGMCSFAGAWLEFLENKTDDSAAIFTTSCDQMRRAFELSACSRKFLLNVPTMTSIRAFSYYLNELTRLQKFLCGISGQTPDWHQTVDLKFETMQPRVHEKAKFVIAMTGGPLNEAVLQAITGLIETAGGKLILNAAENTLRPEGLDGLSKSNDPLVEIARAYFEMPAVWKRPNNKFFETFIQKSKDANGIILVRHSFCDLWHCTGQELAKQSSLPVLELDLDGKGELSTWGVSRIEAFIEGLLG